MNKSEFEKSISEKTGLSLKDSKKAVDSFLETVTEALSSGDNINFVGFGTFAVKERAARTGRNPKTGEPIEISASKIPSFKAGKSLKDSVN